MFTLTQFDYHPRTRLVFGSDTVERTAEFVREIGAKSVLIVTDPGILQAGHVDRIKKVFDEEKIRYHIFDQVIENPTTETVDECVKFARKAKVDLIIGIGGGSSMDTAKGCNFILTNGGTMHKYWGVGKATKPMLPLIAIPTTAGTGSECQSFALISDAKTHRKMACGDPKAAPAISILDPTLTISQPSKVAACTGIDAIAHALETAVTKKRNPISWLFSKEAFKLTHRALPAIFDNPDDINARGEMLLGAAYAGTAIENSMLGSAHATANPLTANYGIIHGQAVGLMLPHIVKTNSSDVSIRDIYHELAIEARLVDKNASPDHSIEALIDWLETILEKISLKRYLVDLEVDSSLIPTMAHQATEQWTGQFNPRELKVNDYISIYESAFAA
jgi:alcohol dehydrogenase